MLIVKIIILGLAIAIFLFAWKMESGRRLILTPFLFAMAFEFTRVLPPFVAAEGYAGIQGIEPLLAAFVAFVSIVTGFVVAYFLHPTGPSRAAVLTISRLGPLSASRSEHIGAIALAVLLVAVGLAFYQGLPPAVLSVASFAAGTNDSLASALMVTDQRFALTKGAYFGAGYRGQGLVSAVQLIGWSLLLGYATLLWLDRSIKYPKGVLLLTLLGAWMFVAGDGTRGPFISVLLFTVVIYSLRKPLTMRGVLIVFSFVVLLGVGLSVYSAKMYFVSSDSNFFGYATSRIIERIFMGNGVNDVHIVDLVNRGDMPLRWGQNHWREVLSAIPGVTAPPPLSYELFSFMNPNSTAKTFASGTYISAVFVDFGWWGLAPIFLLVGAVVALFQKRLLVVRRSPWALCVAAFLGISVANVLLSGFVGVGAQLVVFFVLCGIHRVIQEVAKRLGSRRISGFDAA